ncbi:MAG: RecX family transcriptional regulator [Bacteroidetes bacterium]|nr:RecX family transcriptional regulator [Bacteroidota bacterium]MCW5894369.1 RecX family transcriptional regulator [Bacteroidota bacterium]
MHITKIENQKKNPSRKNLFVDDEFLIGVSAETLLRFGIRTGDEIGEDKLKALRAAEELQGAKSVALRFLSRRQRTEKEVRDKLREKEFADEEIRQTIENLRELGFLNDAEFARSYICHQLTVRPKGTLALKQNLLLLGVRKEVIEAALDETFNETNQEEAALDAARKFLRKSRKPTDDPRKTRQKLAAFLGRRGFTWDVISTVMKNIPGEKADEE